MGERDLFMAEDAERHLSGRGGKPYHPSSGTEGEMFMSRWCAGCQADAAFRADVNADGCSIPVWAMVFDIAHPNYPKEWVWSERGQPVCTAFQAEVRS